MKKFLLVVTAGIVAQGCALKSDIRRVEDQLAEMRETAARADSARAATLLEILNLQQAYHTELSDSLRAQRTAILGLQGAFRSDLTQVLRNMVAMQELMGQSQAGLNDLRTQLDQRLQEIAAQPVVVDSTGTPVPQQPANTGGGPGPDELWGIGIAQYRQSSISTARLAFHRLIALFPDHERAPDAMFHVAESWQEEAPDSSEMYYERIVEQYTQSARAPSALFRLGLLAERLGNESEARLHYQRLVASFPDSEEAARAREKLGGSGSRAV